MTVPFEQVSFQSMQNRMRTFMSIIELRDRLKQVLNASRKEKLSFLLAPPIETHVLAVKSEPQPH